MAPTVLPRNLADLRGPSTTDLVFAELYRRIVELELPPGAKLAELEIAGGFGVSRQPVRDAFYRLSKLGFLRIRPQRATVVTHISEEAVCQARFIRTALEIETIRTAARVIDADRLAALEANVAEQVRAVARDDRAAFFALDETFHQTICALTGHAVVWDLIRDYKAHMDRVRFITLHIGAPSALEDHQALLAALRAHDPDTAAERMRVHLGRITEQIHRLRTDHAEYFADDGG
jgi:DNA-binding GntR family transcriptional regulator